MIIAPLRSEAVALRLGGVRVVRGGMGARAERVAADAVVVAGVCGAVDPALRPGDVVVATELRDEHSVRTLTGTATIARALRDRGLRVVCGPMLTVDHVLGRAERESLRADGVIAVDMESSRLAPRDGVPFAVVRTVVDTADRSLYDLRTLVAGLRALAALRRAAPALEAWSASVQPRRVLLASPRSFCAGVDRAIEIVERAIDQRGAPIYVRKQIVHNSHVVGDLERRGAVFVEELEAVPDGATVVFSAHGVSPAVKDDAVGRRLDVIDATCPLVSKVHAEARRFAAEGKTIFLIGHAGHEEVEGTQGEAPASIRLVEDLADAAQAEAPDPERVAYLTQTTLAVDETDEIVDRLRERYPTLRGPGSEDICYATSNRQNAVRAVARQADVVLVAGSETSSNSKRLAEVARREGARAHLVDDETDVDVAWLAGAATIGITAGASAPEEIVHRLVEAIASLGPVDVGERTQTTESLRFRLPKELTTP